MEGLKAKKCRKYEEHQVSPKTRSTRAKLEKLVPTLSEQSALSASAQAQIHSSNYKKGIKPKEKHNVGDSELSNE